MMYICFRLNVQRYESGGLNEMSSTIVYEQSIKEKETECRGCWLSLAVYDCSLGAQLNFDAIKCITMYITHV
jgi:hypothetical protein